VPRTGKKRVKVTGTVPEELGKEVEAAIASGEFHNQSHVITRALAQFFDLRRAPTSTHAPAPGEGVPGNGSKSTRNRSP